MTRRIVIGCGIGVTVIAVTAGLWFGFIRNGHATDAESANPAAVETASNARAVLLPESKRTTVGVRTIAAEPHELKQARQVSGRVRYDDSRHVEIKAAADGILTHIAVKPGDVVRAGQVLATFHSPEIGAARADVLKRKAELQLSERTSQWYSQTYENLQLLLKAIRQRTPMKQLEADFESRPLGDHRSTLFTEYSKWLLAETSLANVKAAANAGAIAIRTVLEQTNALEAAEAALKAHCEQSEFDARQHRDEARADLADAQRRLELSRQHVNALLGYQDESDGESEDRQTRLSLVDCRAPFDGTIERRQFSVSERVKNGEALFVLADTRRLWIAADLREQDWDALRITTGQELAVDSPALGGQTRMARVQFVGREVSAESSAVPIVAEIDNSDGRLRPGMFVRVTLTIDDPASVLAVPSTAVVEHEEQKFVFINGSREGEFVRRNIETGRDDGEWIEVVRGLEPGTLVVAQGAFVLKSELLLERE